MSVEGEDNKMVK